VAACELAEQPVAAPFLAQKFSRMHGRQAALGELPGHRNLSSVIVFEIDGDGVAFHPAECDPPISAGVDHAITTGQDVRIFGALSTFLNNLLTKVETIVTMGEDERPQPDWATDAKKERRVASARRGR
jgi:hypothetical protein